jgi:low affinity Fe/Cu permease
VSILPTSVATFANNDLAKVPEQNPGEPDESTLLSSSAVNSAVYSGLWPDALSFYSSGMGRNASNGEKGFHVFAMQAANWVGTKWAFLAALLIVALWLVSGPYFHYSDTWQLIINTGTTVVTFLVVFLIQNTQNRDARAIHLKLDEIIKSIDQAQNEMIDIEHLSDDELQKLADKYQKVREECDSRSRRRKQKD